MSMLKARNGLDNEWKEDMIHVDCARSFFNQSHDVTKERFFLVCCRTWMDELVISTADSISGVTYELLWKTLQRIYMFSKSTGDGPSVTGWVLPDLPETSLMDPNFNDFHDMGPDGKYRTLLMNFWRELFRACEEGSLVASPNHENHLKSRRAKRRRVGRHRSAFLGCTDLMKGNYKLPAIYLMISLCKEAGIVTDWLKLCDFAHELQLIFKTFVENDILAGLALVGLVNISTGELLSGLSEPEFITEYFSGIGSRGPFVLSILQHATSLNTYSLRAAVCRQILDRWESRNDDLYGDYELNAINACAVCIDQERPERFISDLENMQQRQRGKRQQKTNNAIAYKSIPERFSSPGFPLLVHVQICLLRHDVQRAADITRTMDSSTSLDDKVVDDAWFNIWHYLLGEGILFLDGNLETPGYLKKRDFLYTYMACQVSQKAKIAMTDFFQEVATKICETDDSSVEEKQYVTLACQQTVLRLLFKMRGLGLNTILEFVQETTWPIEIPGQKSEKDLKVWSANFLLQKRAVPTSLIDKETGLLDLLKRFENGPKTPQILTLESTLTQTREELHVDRTELSTVEKESDERHLKVSTDGNGNEDCLPIEDYGIQKQEAIGINSSSVSDTFHVENQSDQKSEVDDDDDNDVVILDDDDDTDEVLDAENEDSEEVLEIEDDDEEELSGSDHERSDEDEKQKFSDDNEDYVYDVEGPVYLDDENSGCDEDREGYQDEGENEHSDDGEVINSEEKIIEGDSDMEGTHGRSEDESSDDDIEEDRNKDSDESHIDREEDDAVDVDEEYIERDDVDRVGRSIYLGNSNTSQEESTSISNNHGNDRDLNVDTMKNRTGSDDKIPDKKILQSKEGVSVVKSTMPFVSTEIVQDEKFSPFLKATNNEDGRKNIPSNDCNVTGTEHQQLLQKAHNVRTKVAGVGGEFGDTTEEEDANERFIANNTAQADRRADVLRSGLGYASQVEDGYEPEDTHGYTEEEVSEAIHTEDEEDDHTAKHKPPLSDTDTSQQQAEDLARPLSGQPQGTLGNADRQNSIEPTSDDMDMADEHTEQEEDVAAEFSELEENPDGSFESQKPSYESMKAKTLLEFAQKAQNKDNWGHLKDTESIPGDVGSKRSAGRVEAESESNNTCALSFDADDEKYATEGCKSLETEEEEETEKRGVERSSHVNHSSNDKEKDCAEDQSDSEKAVNIEEQESEVVQKDYDDSASAVGYEDRSGTISDVNTEGPAEKLDGEAISLRIGGVGKSNDGQSNCFVVGDESEVASGEEETKGHTIDRSINEQLSQDKVQVSKLSDVDERPSIAPEGEEVETPEETGNLPPAVNHTGEEDNSESAEAAAPSADGDINTDTMPSWGSGELSKDVEVDNGGAHFVSSSNAEGTSGESKNDPEKEDSIQVEDSCAEDKSRLTGDGGSSFAASTRPQQYDDSISVPEEEKPKTDDDILIEDALIGGVEEAKANDGTFTATEDDCIDSTVGLRADPKGSNPDGSMAKGTEVVVQDDPINQPVNKTGNESNPEGTDSVSINKLSDHPIKESASKSAGTGIEQSEVSMDVANECDATGSSKEEKAIKEKNDEGPNQVNMQHDPADAKTAVKDASISRNEEELVIHDTVENESFDIPKYIGGGSEEQPSVFTRRSGGEKKGDYGTSGADGHSLGDESADNDGGSVISGASAISEIFRSHGRKSQERHDDDEAGSDDDESIESRSLGSVDRTVKSEDSVVKSSGKNKPIVNTRASTRASTRATTRLASPARSSKNVEEKKQGTLTRKSRRGLPPRPPKQTSKESTGRITRSKKKIDDEMSAQNITSMRSTRNSTRNRSSITKATTRKQKGNETSNDDAEDVSVQTTSSVRSTRSSTRNRTSVAIAKEQKGRGAPNGSDDDASVETATSVRSTRSSTRKMSVSTRTSKRKGKGILNDNDDDDASVQTMASVRSTRSTTRKMSVSTRTAKRKATGISNDNDDDASVQTTASVRSTRSTTRNMSQSIRISKRKRKESPNDDDDDDVSVQTSTSMRSTRSSSRKRSVDAPTRTNKKVDDTVSYYNWTVKKLQAELKERSIAYPSKMKKKDLIDKLIASDEAK